MTTWQRITSDTPKDRQIWVYAPAYQGFKAIQAAIQWHPDAGFMIDGLRESTHWQELPEFVEPSAADGLSVILRRCRIDECQKLAEYYETIAKSTYEQANRLRQIASDWRRAANEVRNES